MGILNLTPDSFSDGGQFSTLEEALNFARKMVDDGAAIIDIGGESTRPGATPVDPDEEWLRIGQAVATLVEEGVCVSVDTRHAEVAAKAISAGASIINDVSGFRDPTMVEVVAPTNVGLVVMHMHGVPQNMHLAPAQQYEDVVNDVCDYLRTQTQMLLEAGVDRARICVDPGPGFGKTPAQTIEILRNMHEFAHLGFPLMVAVSRKKFLKGAYKIESDDPKERDVASAAEAVMACELGASVIRTHNVALTVQALDALRPYVVLGLGSNVALVANDGEENEGKKAQIELAIAALCQLPDSQIIDIAPYYISEPAYLVDQDEFVNTVVLMRSGIPPKELLEYLHAVEATLGRTRTVENGPRTIDVDIIDYQLYTAISDELTLPHPRAIDRDFVVKPLCDILPGHVLADGTKIDVIPEEKRVGKARRL